MDAVTGGKFINKLDDLLEEELDEWPRRIARTKAKPIRDAKAADMPLKIDCLRYYRGLCRTDLARRFPYAATISPTHAKERVGVRRAGSFPGFPDAHGRLEMGPARRQAARS